MSEIARFREQQQLEEGAARNGLYAPSALSSHDAVIARMQQGAEQLVKLFKQGKNDEAFELWESGILDGRRYG